MRENNLLRYLRILTKEEKNDLKKHLEQSAPKLLPLFKSFLKEGPNYVAEEIDEERLAQRAYPEWTYNKQVLRNRNTELRKALEDFLTQKELRERPLLRQTLLSARMRKRTPSEAFERNLERHEEALDQYNLALDALFLRFYRYVLELDAASTSQNEAELPLLQQARHQLDKSYLAWHLFFELEFANRSRYLEEQFEHPSIDLQAAYWKSLLKHSGPSLHLFYQLYELEASDLAPEEKLAGCKVLFAQLRNQAPNLHATDVREFFTALTNFVGYLYNQRISSYGKLLLRLYRWGHERTLLVEENYLSHSFLINLVITAGINGEPQFAAQLLRHYEPYLAHEVHQATVGFCEALIDFYSHRYKAALHKLQVLDIPQAYDFSVRRQSLLLRIAYERFLAGQCDSTKVEDRCRAFEVFFRRNSHQVNDTLREKYLNLKYFVRSMTYYRVDPNCKVTQEELITDFKRSECIAWQWVEKHLNQLL